MLAVEERRVHAHADAAVDALGGADQLQPEPELVRVGHVVGRDVLDPLVDDLVEVDRGRERQPGEDRHLGGGVAARHVVGRVGLRVAQLLGLHQRLLVGDAGARHLGEDVVRRAVDDPVDALDVRGRKRLLQHADHRHDAGHRALEAQLDLVLARARPQLLPVLGEQLLVGRDDVLARAHRPQHVVARRLDAADQLHDQVRALEDRLEVAAGARQHAAELGAQARGRGDRAGALLQQPLERRADGPVTQQSDAEGLRRRGHAAPRRSPGAPPRASGRRSRRPPAGGAGRCSCWRARTRRRRSPA